MKTAVVYYTRYGHNKVIAEAIAQELGAEQRQVRTPKEHGFLSMGFCSAFNVHMRIEPMDLDFSAFDTVVICAPIWAGKPAAPVYTFLRDAKLDGRKLAFCFSTGGGSSQRAQDKVKRDLASRKVEIVGFGEINTREEDEGKLRQEAGAFARKLRG